MIQDLRSDIEKLVDPILNGEGYDLVEIKLSRFKKKFRLQIFVDSNNGVLLDECARLSGLISTALEMTDFMRDGYLLEVSSPGLDRPLHSDQDFLRKVGMKVKVAVNDNGKDRTVQGTVIGIDDGKLILSSKSGRVEIALSDIRQGKIII
ncbi:MAG: ribosome maturation factor RimP [Planctomycetes bacterium]|nr:ribosome maturation factor RimP [Planctomycetota bacterium]